MWFDVAVVDDNDKELKELTERIGNVCSRMDISGRLCPFYSGEEFLAANALQRFDIVFMDIYLKGISGIDAARSISSDKSCRFIFMTVSTDHAIEAFALNAAHYLLKPADDDAISEAIQRCIPQPPKKDRVLEIKSGRITVPIPIDKIRYIEVKDKLCMIHTDKERIDTHTALGALCALLDNSIFLRIQQSFAVNMHYIDSFFFDRIVLRNGKEITLSRNNKTELRERYQNFLFHLARGE